MAAALNEKNIVAYMSICTADYQQKTQNALIDRVRMRQQLQQLFAAADNYRQKTHVEKVFLNGKEAQVVAIETCEFSMTDPDPHQKPHHYRQVLQNSDLWVFRGNKWLLKHTETRVKD